MKLRREIKIFLQNIISEMAKLFTVIINQELKMKEIAQTCCNKANKMKVNVIKNTMLATEFDPHSQKKDHYCCLKTVRHYTTIRLQLCTQNWGKAGWSWIVIDWKCITCSPF